MRKWTHAILMTSAVFLMGMTGAEESMMVVSAPREPIVKEVKPIEFPVVVTEDTAEVEIKEPTISSYYIVSQPLNKRKTANVDHKPVGYLRKGEPVEGAKLLSNGWVKLIDGSYVNGKYLIIKSSMTKEQFKERVAKFGRDIKKSQEVQKNNSSKDREDSVSREGKVKLTSSERELLARLVRAEAGGEKYEGMVAVAAVVFNRVTSSKFPNTVKDVIYAKNQFSPVANGSIKKPASDIHYKAVDDALSRDNTEGALFFYAPSLVKSPYMESLTTVKVIGVHHFKK